MNIQERIDDPRRYNIGLEIKMCSGDIYNVDPDGYVKNEDYFFKFIDDLSDDLSINEKIIANNTTSFIDFLKGSEYIMLDTSPNTVLNVNRIASFEFYVNPPANKQ